MVTAAELNEEHVLSLVFNNKKAVVLSARTGVVAAALPGRFLPRLELPAILRENLSGLWLSGADAVPGEPIVKLSFKGVFRRTVVFEGLKRSSNILLLDEDGRVIWGLKNFKGEFRKGLPMEQWQPPPPRKQQDEGEPLNCGFDNDASFRAIYDHLLSKAKARQTKSLRAKVKSLEKKRAALSLEAEEAGKWIEGEATGKNLLLSPDLHKRGEEFATVMDYSRTPPEELKIPLDPKLSVHQNAHKFFKLSKRGKERLRLLPARMDEIAASISLLEEKIAGVEEVVKLEDLDAPDKRGGIAKEKKESAKLPKNVVALDLPGGYKGYAGKNAQGNNHVSFRIAKGEDFWFHAADYKGSHVVVRNPSRLEELPNDIEKAAARYAALHSSAPSTGVIEVMVAKAKHLAPVKGAPGAVYVSKSRKRRIDLDEN